MKYINECKGKSNVNQNKLRDYFCTVHFISVQ